MSAHTDNERSEAGGCVPRLVRLLKDQNEALRAVWAAWTQGANLNYAVDRVKQCLTSLENGEMDSILFSGASSPGSSSEESFSPSSPSDSERGFSKRKSRFGEERKALLAKLSGMHDQFCHCMGRHPDALLLTPYSAEVLGWEEGFRTPFYATVTDTAEMQDIFTANA